MKLPMKPWCEAFPISGQDFRLIPPSQCASFAFFMATCNIMIAASAAPGSRTERFFAASSAPGATACLRAAFAASVTCVEEGAGACFPAHAQREIAAVFARAFKRRGRQAADPGRARRPAPPVRPITSRGAAAGNAATGTPLASASSSTSPKVSVRLGKRTRRPRHRFAPVPRPAGAEKHRVGIGFLRAARAPARRRPPAWCRADRARERPRRSFPPPAARR